MKRWFCLAVLLVLMAWGGTAWAAHYYSECEAWAGPPGSEWVRDSGDRPTYASGSEYDRDVETRADYWEVGGRLHHTWDSTYQGWTLGYALCDKDFEVIAAGEATISFSWAGSLEAVGSSDYDKAGWYLYAYAEMNDSRGTNAEVY